MSVFHKAIDRYRSGGALHLVNEICRFLFDRLESIAPSPLKKVVLTVYWLPYFYILARSETGYKLSKINSSKEFHFPQLRHHRRFRQKGLNRKRDLYYGFGEVSIEPGDRVVDIGAFIGEASISIADIASEIYPVEPSPRSYACLEKNAQNVECITPVNCGAWNESGEMDFNLGTDATDDSILEPDHGGDGSVETVSVDTIENICLDLGVASVDFMKVEAEGVEPEVLKGLGDLRPTKIAVNCDPERQGKSTEEEVTHLLSDMGYETYSGGGEYYTIVYAKFADE